MVVVVIIGLLAGAVTIKVVDYLSTARVNRARNDIASIVNAVETYAATNKGRYPTTEEGLSGLPITNKTDPWGNDYDYVRPGIDGQGNTVEFVVTSYGADGVEGGDDEDQDIYSWQLNDEGNDGGG
jgi:general secretion pathway protein G